MSEKVGKKGNEKADYPFKRNFSKNANLTRIKSNIQNTALYSDDEYLSGSAGSKFIPEKTDPSNVKNENKKKEEKVYIIPLGGIEEVGKNMTAFQYKDEIIIVDAGLTFPEDEHLGIDVIIPDFSYLESNRDKIKALLLTHGHEDHIGAIPYLYQKLGSEDIPMYGGRLTLELAKAKFEITNGMKKDGFFVYNGDEPLLKELVENSSINATSCGENSYNDIILENYTITRDKIDFKLSIDKNNFSTTLKGKHNLFNIMFAVAIAKKIGLTNEEIRHAIDNISKITNMRLESIPYGEDSLIINDAYNASPTSMKAAVDVISDLNDFEFKTLVLGSMFELGPNEVEYHNGVGTYINNNSHGINLVISVGDLAKNITDNINNKDISTLHFSTVEEVTDYLKANKHKNEVILFKASRSMKLETIINDIK